MWDRLINEFTGNILAGTSVVPAGQIPDTARAEEALRNMALEPRVIRRFLGQSVADALTTAERERYARFCRVLLPEPRFVHRNVLYVLLILAYPAHLQLLGGYEQYRNARTSILHAYCLNALSENRHIKRAIGIAIDASSRVTGRKGGSGDLLALGVEEWTQALEEELREARKEFDIMKPECVRRGVASIEEYPTPPHPPLPPGLNRQQRRAMERARSKASRKR